MEPFRTHEALDQAALDLAADLQAAREALSGVARQQGYTAVRLQGDCEALHRATYTELQQLVLEPQVCPTAEAGRELLCPNAQVGVPLTVCLTPSLIHFSQGCSNVPLCTTQG